MAFCTIFVCMYINKDISLYNYMYAWCVVNSLFFNDFVIICLFVIYIYLFRYPCLRIRRVGDHIGVAFFLLLLFFFLFSLQYMLS